MRVGLAGVGALLDSHRPHPFGYDDAGHFPQVAEELLEPEFEIETIPQDELGILCPQDVARGWLVVVDLRPGLGDRLHDSGTAGHMLRYVGDDGEGGDNLELALCGVSR
jgi:hypothetical protein